MSTAQPDLRCLVLAPYSFSGRGPAESCAQLTGGMARGPFTPHVHAGRVRAKLPESVQATAPFAPLSRSLPWRYVERPARQLLERQFRHALDHADPATTVAWFWPGSPVSVVRHARELGIVTVREMINSTLATARPILDSAYARLGLPPTHGMTDERVAAEIAELQLYDFAFASNPEVEKSLDLLGFAPERVLRTTFGWNPARFVEAAPLERSSFRAVFVGRIGVRKGVPDLLDAWSRAGVRGELLLVGSVDAEVAPLVEQHVRTGRVRLHGYADNPAAVYAASDVFIFPTLEEGGPQVTYEAAGCGLPVITTPMGAARLVEHGRTGLVVDPASPEQLTEAIRVLARDEAMRLDCAAAARRAAMNFTYETVGTRRGELLAGTLAADATTSGQATQA